MSSSGNWLSYAERGGALRTRQTFLRSLQVMVRRRRNLLFKLLLLMICISVVAGVYVVGFSTEEEDMERGGGRHRERGGVEEVNRIITKGTTSPPTEPTGAIENPDSDEKRVFDGHHFVPASNNDKEDSTPSAPPTTPSEPTDEVQKILDGRHLVPVNDTEEKRTMPRGNPLELEHNKEQRAIVSAFKHAWKAYKESAWGKDELKPISHTSSTWFNLGLTLVDSLDTMWLMGLKEEFKEARDWVENDMVIAQKKDVNLFECTIRVLGGLLSTYHLTKDHMFLEKATDLGDRLLHAFATSSHIPYSDVNLFTLKAHAPKWGPDSSVSEVTSIQLEFRDLSQLTGNKKYQETADLALDKVQGQARYHNLIPKFINADTGRLRDGGIVTLGARADSYYEYLLKLWLQSGKKEGKFLKWYLESFQGVQEVLLRKSEPKKLTFIGESRGSNFIPKMDHLVCFYAGLLALGSEHVQQPSHLKIGKDLLYTCWQMYERMPTGLSPEIVYFNIDPNNNKEDIIVKYNDRHNLLRPETVESLFVLYRLTKDPKYRDWGWRIFQSFETYTKLKDGYSSINNVQNPQAPEYRDKMESFFLGETLKYLFLLFCDEDWVLPLDEWVFNTEAHPLPIWVTR